MTTTTLNLTCKCDECCGEGIYTYYLTAHAAQALARALRRRGAEVAYRGEYLVVRCSPQTLREAMLAVSVLPTTWCINSQPLAIAKEQWL